MYHGFTAADEPLDLDQDPHELLLPLRRLREQIAELKRRDYRFLTEEEYLLERRAPTAGRSVLITIDDGMRSVLDIGAPVLEEEGVPSVLYVSAGLSLGDAAPPVDETHKPDGALLTADELAHLPARGMALGSHGWDHSTVVGSDDESLRAHTAGSRELLAQLIGSPPRTFAYPYGRWDDRSARAVAAAGYELAFSLQDGRDDFSVDRVDVKPGDSLTAFRIKLAPFFRTAWRATRRVPALSRAARTVTWRLR
ncbi:polysaccharide deacetylase family protein [Klenkia sp. LSe6-5]|uniref:Polysaccharide deacetylase family protein n=1 Tax=Klenkia sesuvii TaxID=3103137 RepID=A0ABU8DWK9_9ACTN